MAAGKTTVARALAAAARLARRGRRRADRSARTPDRRRHLRAARRALLPRRRARDPAAAPAAAPHRRGHRRRHVRRPGEPAGDQRWTACRSGSTCRSTSVVARLPADGRRPLAADRAADGAAVRVRQAAYAHAHLRVDASGPSPRRSPNALSDGLDAWSDIDWSVMAVYLILSDIHANLDALEAVLAAVGRRVGSRARARRPGRLRRGAQCGRRSRARARSRRRSSAATTTRRRAASTTAASSTTSRAAALWTRRRAHAGRTATTSARCRQGRVRSTTASRSATARRSTKITTSSTPTTPARAGGGEAAALPVRAHAPAGRSSSDENETFDGYVPDVDDRRSLSRCSDGARYLINVGSVGQPRDGDPRAAFAHLRRRDARRSSCAGCLPGRRGAAADHRGRPAGKPGQSAGGGTVGLEPRCALRGPSAERSGARTDSRTERLRASVDEPRAEGPVLASASSRSSRFELRRVGVGGGADPRIQPMTMPTSRTAGMKMKCAASSRRIHRRAPAAIRARDVRELPLDLVRAAARSTRDSRTATTQTNA